MKKLLFLIFIFVNQNSYAQVGFTLNFQIGDTFCVGEPVIVSYEFDSSRIAHIDSVHWKINTQGYDIGFTLDTVAGSPFSFFFPDTFNFLNGQPHPPIWENIVYATDINGNAGSLLGGGGGVYGISDCEIHYADMKVDRQKICTDECINYMDASDRYPRHHKWYFEGGNPAYSEERNPRNICYASPGKYAVRHYVSNTVNSDSIIIDDYIEVLPRPELLSDSIIELEGYFGDTLQLIACSKSSQYLWSPIYQISCNDCPNPIIILGNQTEYLLTSWNDNACVQTCRYKIKINQKNEVKKDSKIYVPNVFSPNGDLENDEFEIFGVYYELKLMQIYDRWGGLLFQSTSPTAKWDGKYRNKDLGPGVYTYRIIYTDTNTMVEQNQVGTITIVR